MAPKEVERLNREELLEWLHWKQAQPIVRRNADIRALADVRAATDLEGSDQRDGYPDPGEHGATGLLTPSGGTLYWELGRHR